MRTLTVLLMCLSSAACAVDTYGTSSQASEGDEEAVEVSGRDLAIVRRATAKYHNIDNAIADGFVPINGDTCIVEETEDGPAAIGIFYINPAVLFDDVVDPTQPEALIYEPQANGSLKLVGAEYIVLFSAWTDAEAPTVFGAELHAEAEMGLYGLHFWVWRHNPEGMTAEANPNVSCTP